MEKLMNELGGKIISALKLSDVKPEDIDVDAPLIGAGLSLDSIDTPSCLLCWRKITV